MKRFKLLGLACVALVSLAGSTTGTAHAITLEALPEGLKFTFKGAAGSQLATLGGKVVECSSVVGGGEFASKRSGTMELKFSECATGQLGVTVKCTGLEAGDKEGEILFKAEFHIRHLLVGGNPSGVALMISVGHVHFECGAVLYLVLGDMCSNDLLTAKAGEDVVNKLRSSVYAAFASSGNGDAAVSEVDADNSLGMEKCELLVKEGTSEANKYESAALTSEGTLEGFRNKAGESVTALIDLTGGLLS